MTVLRVVKPALSTPTRYVSMPVPPASATPIRLSGPAGASEQVSYYASAVVANTKAASRPDKQGVRYARLFFLRLGRCV